MTLPPDQKNVLSHRSRAQEAGSQDFFVFLEESLPGSQAESVPRFRAPQHQLFLDFLISGDMKISFHNMLHPRFSGPIASQKPPLQLISCSSGSQLVGPAKSHLASLSHRLACNKVRSRASVSLGPLLFLWAPFPCPPSSLPLAVYCGAVL
jgi:hypothetical protein